MTSVNEACTAALCILCVRYMRKLAILLPKLYFLVCTKDGRREVKIIKMERKLQNIYSTVCFVLCIVCMSVSGILVK